MSWREGQQKWHAYLRVSGVLEHLGYFDDELEAAKAVDRRLREVGKLESLNYDDDGNFVYVGPTKSSKYKGVGWKKEKEKWQVIICVPGEKRKHLGYFEDEADAARAYDAEARKHAMPTNFQL